MTPARTLPAALAVAALFAIACAAAQAQPPMIPPGPRGVVDNPCPPPLQPPPELAQAIQHPDAPPPPAVAAFLAETNRRASVDWPNLCRYAPDDAALIAAGGSPPTAVFLGDSITEGWARIDPSFFTSNGLVGRGINGQVSGQTLLRFEQDVAGLRPKVVHIMIGTNDIAGNAGPTTYGDIERNLSAMVELARANGIRVVLATVPPSTDFPWRRGMQPASKIIRLNRWIRDYAKREHIVVADYHAALANPEGGLRTEWTVDGVHPNAAGFRVMEPIASEAIRAALAGTR
jgi:lysophospholipase L1-like esterase